MNDSSVVALLVALAALVGNIWITSLNLRQQFKIAERSQQEARRTKRQDYLMQLMDKLLKAAGDFQAFLGTSVRHHQSEEGDYEHSEIIGRAIAACLATNDDALRIIAEGVNGEGLTPYRLQQGEDGSKEDYMNRNRNALLQAIKRMAELINETE